MADKKSNGTGGGAWYAHFIVTSRCYNGTIDCFADVSALMPRLRDFDLKRVSWEGGCCGQTQCACCAGVIGSVSLVAVKQMSFPFALHGKLAADICRRVKAAMDDDNSGDDDDDDKADDDDE